MNDKTMERTDWTDDGSREVAAIFALASLAVLAIWVAIGFIGYLAS